MTAFHLISDVPGEAVATTCRSALGPVPCQSANAPDFAADSSDLQNLPLVQVHSSFR